MNTITNIMHSTRARGSSAFATLILGVLVAFVAGFGFAPAAAAQTDLYGDYCSSCGDWSFGGYDTYYNDYQPYSYEDDWSFGGYDTYYNDYQPYAYDDSWYFGGYDTYYNDYQPYSYDNSWGYYEPYYYNESYYYSEPYYYSEGGYQGGYYYEPYYYSEGSYQGGYQGYYEGSYNPPHDDQPECDISADDTSIEEGDSARLSWNSDDAHEASLNQGIGNVALDGSRSVSPRSDTTYTLTVRDNDGDRDTCSVTITVDEDEDEDLECDITASPRTIEDGDEVTLRWNSHGADRARINQGLGSVSRSGSEEVSPDEDTTYTMTVENGNDEETCSVTVRVDEEEDDISCELTASNRSIEEGDEVTLRWETDGDVDDARFNQGIGRVDEDGGTRRVSPNSDTRYVLTVENDNGDEDTCSVTIDVDDGLAPPPDVPLVYLSQLPYTGAEDTLTYWLLLITGSGLIGYMLFFRVIPFAIARVSLADGVTGSGEEEVSSETASIPDNVTRQEVRAFVSALAEGDLVSAKEFASTMGSALFAEAAVVLDDVARARREGTTTDGAVAAMTGDWDGAKMDRVVASLSSGNAEEVYEAAKS